MTIEKLTIENRNVYPEREWAFRQPTVLIESQSAPALRGVASEQVYMRAFPLARSADLVVTDFHLNKEYVEKYLKRVLGFDMPKFLVTPNQGQACLSEHIMTNPETLDSIKKWGKAQTGDVKVQFFNITDSEENLLRSLDFGSTNGNIESAIILGSKPGFRRFCEAAGVPIPAGEICKDTATSLVAIKRLFNEGKNVLIKSEYGTGGAVLKSNVLLTKEELNASFGGELEKYVSEKLSSFGDILGEEWEIEEFVDGEEGSVHVYIKDANSFEKAFVLGQTSEDNSYVGGYFPIFPNKEIKGMIKLVEEKIVPRYQKFGVYGYHCFDFKGDKFLEDNTRQGALDFIDGTVKRIIDLHFPKEPYSWWHKHVSISKPTNFEQVWNVLGQKLDPKKSLNGCFGVVTNPEVLPFGGSLDLTVVSVGASGSLEAAKSYFKELEQIVLKQL